MPNRTRPTLALTCAAVLLLCAAGPAGAQTGTAALPYDPVVDSLFEAGLRHFEAGRYDDAHAAFEDVHTGRRLNRRTTAALLMDGKALYADSASAEAAHVLTRLLESYPDSRYRGAALETLRRAEAELDRARRIQEDVFTLGILLPLNPQDRAFTRSLVGGIRLAVEEHNASGPRNPVRMVFRDSGGQADGVRGVVRSMAADDGVEAIIGPLYSEEAVAAGQQTDREAVVMIVPLATDAEVAERRRYVYQVNPPFEKRGQLIARYALERLGYRRLGVLVERGTAAERYAQSFASEVAVQAGRAPLYAALSGMRAWYQLKNQIPEDSLRTLDAVYVPVTGASAAARIAAALDGIDQVNNDLPVLGNGEWSGRTDLRRLTRHRLVFTNSFYIDSDAPAVQAFRARYLAATSEAPDDQAHVGYDTARYLLTRLGAASSKQTLREAIDGSEPYTGLAGTIDFSRGHVNDALHFLEATPGGIRLRD